MRVKSYGLTDIGLKRKINQDAFACDDTAGVFVVADGMGGHQGGEVASQLAVDVIQKFCRENTQRNARDLLNEGINLSSQQIYDHSQSDEELAGMGTTVLALLFKEDSFYLGQVGDSRAYLIHENHIWQVTEDHSLLNEELRSGRLPIGQIAQYQFKNVITRSVGYENQVTVDIYRRKVKAGDQILMCSDGLSGLVDSKEMMDVLIEKGPEKGLKALVDLANERGGDDNITVVLCEVVGDE